MKDTFDVRIIRDSCYPNSRKEVLTFRYNLSESEALKCVRQYIATLNEHIVIVKTKLNEELK